MKRDACAAAVAAAGFIFLWGYSCGVQDPNRAVAQEPAATQGTVQARPQSCASYADCPSGMICAGAGGGATGTCMWPTQLPHPRPAYDALPRGYLGSIYGHPIIQGQAPAGAPSSDRGGVWDMKDGTYRPPRGGKWAYRPAGANGFGGAWVYSP
jgi:hypothetical protein